MKIIITILILIFIAAVLAIGTLMIEFLAKEEKERPTIKIFCLIRWDDCIYPEIECNQCEIAQKEQTNYEKVKEMSIEDMALMIMCPYDTLGDDVMPCIDSDTASQKQCYECTLNWLKKEAKNEERCISCGETIPEGRLMCPLCERSNNEI